MAPRMRLILATGFLICCATPAICQTSPPTAEAQVKNVQITGLEAHQRADNYGIASFKIINGTDAPLNSIELNCWLDDDRSHGTKVLVWPSSQAVAPHDSEQFSNVNIGLVRSNSHPECEVTGVE